MVARACSEFADFCRGIKKAFVTDWLKHSTQNDVKSIAMISMQVRWREAILIYE